MQNNLELMAGITFVIFGLSYLIRTKDWVLWLDSIRAGGRVSALAIGAVHTLLGAFIVGFHWVWNGWTAPSILTFMGVWALVEGVVYLLFPAALEKWLALMAPAYTRVIRVAGILVLILGAALLCPWMT